jgi:hypothetical protein
MPTKTVLETLEAARKTAKQLEDLGRECVRELQENGADKAVVVIIGSMPRQGFPRGRYLGDHTDGRKIRVFQAFKLLGSIQQFMNSTGVSLAALDAAIAKQKEAQHGS